MSTQLQDMFEKHIVHARKPNCEIKVYVECTVNQITHEMIRTYLQQQSVGPCCTNDPTYRELPISLQTIYTKQSPQSNTPPLCCYRSIICEPISDEIDPSDYVRFSTQQIVARDRLPTSTKKCHAYVETVQTVNKPPSFVQPYYIQKENGFTYFPLEDTDEVSCVVEVYQQWRAPTFEMLESQVLSGPTQKCSKFGIRLTAILPTKHIQHTTQLQKILAQTLQYSDVLVHG